MWRLNPVVILGAAWALLAVMVARRRLRKCGIRAKTIRAPRLSSSAIRGVSGILHRLSPTCLERALVAQSWMAARGEYRDVVIGIPRGGLTGARAHAWVDGSPSVVTTDYVEIHRLSTAAR
jgi:Transglutaminase-like superfamily